MPITLISSSTAADTLTTAVPVTATLGTHAADDVALVFATHAITPSTEVDLGINPEYTEQTEVSTVSGTDRQANLFYRVLTSDTDTSPTIEKGSKIEDGDNQVDYNGTAARGVFDGGSGWTNPTDHGATITVTGGAVVTINNVTGDAVDQFTVSNTADTGNHFPDDVLVQIGTTGGGADFSLTPDTANLGGARTAAIVLVFRGVDTSTPFDVAVTSNTSEDDVNAANPAITPSANNGALVLFKFVSSSGTRLLITGGKPTTPAGLTLGPDTFQQVNFTDAICAYDEDYGTGGSPITPGAWFNTCAATFVNLQDETSYDNSPGDDGIFDGGINFTINDTITMTGGATVNADFVNAGTGAVEQFTVTTGADTGEHLLDTEVASTGGTGTGFTLSPGKNNLSSNYEADNVMMTIALRPASGATTQGLSHLGTYGMNTMTGGFK